MSNLIQRLLKRGDKLSISNGQLCIETNSGKQVPSDWYKKNAHKILIEISQQLNLSIYSYSYYKTGRYNQGRSPGVLVRFLDLLTGEDAYAIFNANLNRKRTTKKNRAGSPRPDGQFSVGDRSAFYLFWIKAGLELPRRLSEWHKSMSKLKPIYFLAEKSSHDKLSNKSIRTLSLSHREIKGMFSDKLAATQKQAGDSLATYNKDKIERQDKATNNSDKVNATAPMDIELEDDLNRGYKKVRTFGNAEEETTSISNHVSSNQVMADNDTPNELDNGTIDKQSNDEWLSHYIAAERI